MKFLVSMYKTLAILLFLISVPLLGQEITILDMESKEPIVNVAVYNTDKSKTSITDFDGKCDLSLFDKNERIFFKHLGYAFFKASKAVVLKKDNTLYLFPKAQELNEVVMSISKWEQQKKDIPQKIVSIDAKSIAFSAPQTAADLLQNSGKVFVQKSQLGGGSPMIRGFSTNRLLLSVDGVRMNNAIFRGGNIQNVISIDPFSVKNTEVIFGPGSVIYGSDAIGGVMNFLTKKVEFSETDGTLFKGVSNYRYATANTENTAHVDFNIGKKQWAFLTSVSYSDFGDLKMGKYGEDSYLRENYVQTTNGKDVLLANTDNRLQVPTGYNQINLLQKIAFKPNSNWDINWSNYYSETSDYSRYDRLIRPNSAGDGLRSAEWYYGPQKWLMSNLQFNKNGKGKFYDGLKVTTAYQHFEESRHDRGFQDAMRYSTEEKVDALSTNIDFENKRIGDLRLYYGGEYIFNKVHSSGTQLDINTNETAATASRYPDGSTWQTLAGYVSAEYKAKPNLSLLSGVRYSHVWVAAEFEDTYYSFPFDNADLSTGALTGSLGLSWFPKADLQITANTSTGFRAPNIDDVGKIFDSEPGSVVVPNPDLEPEYAYNMELGIQKNIKDKVMLKGATFYTYMVDALVRRDFEFNGMTEMEYNGELSNVQAIQNAAKAYVYGFEFGVDVTFSERMSLASNLTLTKGIEEEDDGTDSPGRHVAPTFGDVHCIWKNQKLKTDLFLNFNGEVAFDDLAVSERSKEYIYAADSNGNPYAPSWYTLNFRSQYALSNTLKTTINLENITNQRYRSYSSGIVAPGINLVLALEYTF
ncbi:TonB-dependent receptor [Cellulophaga algicola DSM 14237]|uniref:TonB-dependent receptor n=1 Tax=Cellulophaga algicola (strain DSM 14237 / IC166 / ACAM 630) TaxID=688270 RepID=E6X764_CELAD|nr:TonB-dependent receptor [Cellulophaga algicola]ADV48517.1 TonB-dependent receptor [Cellulophaga algicola DSM 14237]